MALYSFFFSSRRRHTRSLRDWSSDVCSSDLESAPFKWMSETSSYVSCSSSRCQAEIPRIRAGFFFSRALSYDGSNNLLETRVRSEERRVGKECRPGSSPLHYSQNAQGRTSVE